MTAIAPVARPPATAPRRIAVPRAVPRPARRIVPKGALPRPVQTPAEIVCRLELAASRHAIHGDDAPGAPETQASRDTAGRGGAPRPAPPLPVPLRLAAASLTLLPPLGAAMLVHSSPRRTSVALSTRMLTIAAGLVGLNNALGNLLAGHRLTERAGRPASPRLTTPQRAGRPGAPAATTQVWIAKRTAPEPVSRKSV